jgi:glutathione S-transferase
VADQHPASNLAPATNAGIERYRMIEWLSFISSELHKAFSPLFQPGAGEELKKYALGNLHKRAGWLNAQLGTKTFVAADHFTVADAYLFTVLSWSVHVKFDLATVPNLQRYVSEIGARSAVISAMKAERLIK